MPCYAQFDSKGRVFSVSRLADVVDQSGMVEIPNEDINLLGQYYNPSTKKFEKVTVTVDKATITADGFDTATVTAKVPSVLIEIAFFHADTGEAIATVPVDPATHTATLQVTATTPGTIRIRAGEPTITRLNEVVITAQ